MDTTELLTLSICLETEAFSFTVYSSLNKQSIVYYHRETVSPQTFIAKLKQLFSELEFLNQSYKQITILTVDNRFTVVPVNFFDKEHVKQIFNYNQLEKANECVLYNILEKNDTAIIFGIDKDVFQFLTQQYPQATIYSQTTALIDYFSTIGVEENLSKRMCVCLHDKSMDICCFESKRLLFANAFECKQIEDRIYYLLYVWKQVDFNQETNKLYLMGTISDMKEFVKELKRYILNIFIIRSTDKIEHVSSLFTNKITESDIKNTLL
ncbi:hypothetical protein EZS27_014964 [termite gut metagenome]|uniref:DUF3822 family protein n=1 Tax=termite gut metagenome TaxID=433724 RepID=A0A5J4RSK1_9ZZZZ